MRIAYWPLLILTACSHLSTSPKAVEAGPDQALLIVPEAVDVMQLDNTSHNYLNRKGELRLPVNAGPHQLQLRYQQLFDQGSDQQQVVSSSSLNYSVQLQAGQQYRIQIPDLPSAEQAKEFADNPQFKLVSDQQQQNLTPVQPVAVQPVAAALPVVSPTTTNPQDSQALQQLKHWWQQATPAEQEAFFRWKAR